MPDLTAADPEDLLARPREALDIEVKSWLDLGDNNQRADLAKAILAIANHGGGFVVIGLAEADAGQFTPDPDRPADLSHLTQDDIQDAVQKYLEPPIQCRVHHVEHPKGHGRFPVIVVPGGHRVPIKAKVGSPDGKVVANRVYIRRPGPRSEEPQTAAEWDQLFERCIRARRDELLEGIRDLLAGVVPKVEPVTETTSDRLADFMMDAMKRWRVRVNDLPVDAAPRFPHGFYEVAVALEGDFPVQSAGDFLDVMKGAVRNHTGVPPFPITGRDVNRPKPVDGAIEAWFGPDEVGNVDALPSRSDFWRVAPDGLFYTRRGFDEDGRFRGIAPGTSFNVTTPTWRLGEILLQVNYIAVALGAGDATAHIRAKWCGLKGRRLVSIGSTSWQFVGSNSAQQNEYETAVSTTVAALHDATPEIVYDFLKPLYELFDFFELPKQLVEAEIRKMRSHRF